MKAVIVKCAMLVVIIISLVHYALYLKTGQLPWQSPMLSNVLSESLPVMKLESAKLGSGKTQVYKWIDEQGVLNYSQEPPPATVTSEVLEVDPNVNLIQGTSPSAPVTATRPQSILIGDSTTNEQPQTPIEKAQAAKALLEARNREQQEVLDRL
jgi:hypothetical protein